VGGIYLLYLLACAFRHRYIHYIRFKQTVGRSCIKRFLCGSLLGNSAAGMHNPVVFMLSSVLLAADAMLSSLPGEVLHSLEVCNSLLFTLVPAQQTCRLTHNSRAVRSNMRSQTLTNQPRSRDTSQDKCFCLLHVCTPRLSTQPAHKATPPLRQHLRHSPAAAVDCGVVEDGRGPAAGSSSTPCESAAAKMQ
jgi:hypothetical protein